MSVEGACPDKAAADAASSHHLLAGRDGALSLMRGPANHRSGRRPGTRRQRRERDIAFGLSRDRRASTYERAGWDPKDGELCPARTKPEETLVEVRSSSDVQIDCQSWV